MPIEGGDVGMASFGGKYLRSPPTGLSVSVVVPSYLSASTIEDCLKSLDSQELPRERYEVIVVDSGNDETQMICKRHEVRYYTSTNKLSAGIARNVGAEGANGEIIAFMDSDCIAPHQWLNQLLKDFDDLPDAFGVLGVYTGGNTGLDKVRGGELMPYERRINIHHGFIEGNSAFRRKVFETGCRFGDMTYGECIKLSAELAQRHMKTVWDPTIKVLHKGHLTYKRMFTTDRTYFRAILKEDRGALARGILKLLFSMSLFISLPLWPLVGLSLLIILFAVSITYSLRDNMIACKYRLRFLPTLVATRLSRLFASALETLLYLTEKGVAR